jgi:hypothetical protein
MLKLVARVLSYVLFLTAASSAFADAAGSAQGVDPEAEARAGETRTLVVGADIFIGDRIVTGPTGQVQILFSDSTKLVVGPRSALLIEDYLIREDGSAGKMVLDALGGTFRFVTGRAPKDRYVINTPGGTIGVRGTAFELWSSFEEPLAYLLLQNGGACTGDECATHVCEVLKIAGGESEVMGNAQDASREDRAQFKKWFKYGVSESGLLSRYRLPKALVCLGGTSGPGGGGSLLEGGDDENMQDSCDDCSINNF